MPLLSRLLRCPPTTFSAALAPPFQAIIGRLFSMHSEENILSELSAMCTRIDVAKRLRQSEENHHKLLEALKRKFDGTS